MTVPAIQVSTLGKCYRRPVAGMKGHVEDFWALRNVSFEIPEGKVCGIIGKNGAGKSTLLKLLSRITSPTTGEIRLRGRVGSLLEVGTGFHPELTGRENVFLNGSILGMTRTEIKAKFDEIVEFSGVGAFLDTPVKHYSSGMYTRLAFSVAAHLEPEILVVDEVLAVGDIQFQKKCLQKVREVSSEGRTVLFVSHSMDTIQALCSMSLVLKSGQTDGLISTADAVHDYLRSSMEQCAFGEWASADGVGDHSIRLHGVRLLDTAGKPITSFVRYDDHLTLELQVRLEAATPEHTIGFAVYDESQRLMFWSFQSDDYPSAVINQSSAPLVLKTNVPVSVLQPGRYRIKPLLGIYNREWIVSPDGDGPELIFDLQGSISPSPYWLQTRPGVIAPRLRWELMYG